MKEERKSGNPFKKLDDLVLAGANVAVRAYNWTTGGTKAELANGLLWTGTGIMSATSPYEIPIVLPLVYLITKINQYHEKKEILASDSQLKDLDVEKRKTTYALLGYMSAGFSAIYGIGIFTETESKKILKDSILSLGMLTISLSEHIMRADYLPPQKDIVARLIDRYHERQEQKTLIPVPIRV